MPRLTAERSQPILTPEERARLYYECGDVEDPAWETLTATERAGWIAAATGDDELQWSQWSADTYQ